jgi:hypothetical protein
MLTRHIDQAFDALAACKTRLPWLRDLYRPGTPEHDALEAVLGALQRADAVLLDRPSGEAARQR